MTLLLLACTDTVAVRLEGLTATVTGEPVSASVTALGPRGGILAEAESDEQGRYELVVVDPPAELQVHARGEGLSGWGWLCPAGGRLPTLWLGDGEPVLVEGALVGLDGEVEGLRAVTFRRGWNGRGPVVDTVGTELDGLFSVELEAGPWTAEVGAARFPVLAGGPAPIGIVADPGPEQLVFASVDGPVHLVGPLPGNTSSFHVWEQAPAHPSDADAAVVWGGGPVERVEVLDRRPGLYSAGLYEAPAQSVLQVLSVDGGAFAQAAPDSQGAWAALDLDDRIRHVESYAAGVDPADPEAWTCCSD